MEKNEIPADQLFALIEKWRWLARRKFADAELASGMEKRIIEHGAMCYFNAIMELEDVLRPIQAASEPQP